LIFFPIFFSKRLFELPVLMSTLYGFAAFSLIASVVYVINDIRDVEKDRAHPTKCKRPIASGAIKPKSAAAIAVLLFALSIAMNFLAAGFDIWSWVILFGYFALNLGYSFGLKNIPLLDVAILASGFLLRLLYGSTVTSIQLSAWLCLTTILASFYLGFGKRRNEYTLESSNKRDVLERYSYNFLDKSMNMCMTLALVFYSLWTVDISQGFSTALIWTVPFLLLIVLKYNFNIEKNSDGDPTEVIFKDFLLLGMIVVYAILMFTILYF
jgi:4-hydroxybenzoate polyprenyltransferase